MWLNDHDEFNSYSEYNIDSDCFNLWRCDSYFAWWSFCYHFRNVCFSYCKCCRMWLNDHYKPDSYSEYNFDTNCFDLRWSDAYFAWWSYCNYQWCLCFSHFKCCRMWLNDHNEFNSYSKYNFDTDYFDLWWSDTYLTWWCNSNCEWNLCFSHFKCSGMWLNDHNELDCYPKYDFNSDCFNLWWRDACASWWSYCNGYWNLCFSYYKCSGMWFNDHNQFDGYSKYSFNPGCFDLWWCNSCFAWWCYCNRYRNLYFTYFKCSRMWLNDHDESDSYSEYNFNSGCFNLWWCYAYFAWWSYSYNFRNLCFVYCECSGMWFNNHNELNSYSEYHFNSDCFNLWWRDAYFAWWCNCYNFGNVCFTYCKCCGMWLYDHDKLDGYSEYNFDTNCFDLWWRDSFFTWWCHSYRDGSLYKPYF